MPLGRSSGYRWYPEADLKERGGRDHHPAEPASFFSDLILK